MNWYETLLFVHVLTAFVLVAALVMFWTVTLAALRADRASAVASLLSLGKTANVLVIAGAVGTLVFGVWLAIYLDGYELWDPWILISLVLWAVATEAGRRGAGRWMRSAALAEQDAGRDAPPSPELAAALRERSGLLLDLISSLSVLVILILMIFKPGGV